MKRLLLLLSFVCLGAFAASPSSDWKLALPEGSQAFKFGQVIIPDFKNVMMSTLFNEQNGYGFTAADGLKQNASTWPDALTGPHVSVEKENQFKLKLPNGNYLVWLCAGKIIRADLAERRFVLKINETSICDEKPTDEEFTGDKYLCRFMWTQYSERPHALWSNYIDKMYPSSVQPVSVKDGTLTISALNYFLSALIIVPAEQKSAFNDLLTSIRDKRMADFEKTVKPLANAKPERKSGDGDYLLYVPQSLDGLMPWSGPDENERKRTKIEAAGAPGQRVLMVVAVTPFEDLGKSSLVVSDLTGPGTIPAASVKGHFKNFRFDGKPPEKNGPLEEMALVPSLTLDAEKGVTQSFWLWLTIPTEAKAGIYKGTFSFKPEKGTATDMPVEFEVYPFKLESNLPIAYGLWGSGYTPPFLSKEDKRKIFKDRLEWMREIGFTSFEIEPPAVKGLKGSDEVEIEIDPEAYELAKETGMARRPEQGLLIGNIMAGPGRKLGSLLPGSRGVYNSPGIELKQPEFKKCFMSILRQYHDYLQKVGVPVVVTAVDEPRERAINSWNRNLADTIVYCDMVHEAGLTGCCNPMYDTTHGKDYTPLIDHVDILSTHAWKNSEKFMTQTLQKKKTLWLYNCGKDRYSWGFYNWRSKSNGRWEWHFCWPEDNAAGGYPGREWYNPFTGMNGSATLAPPKFKGGLLYKSAFLDMAEGINDQAYLYTLEEALKSDAGKNSKIAEEARTFLTALERAMPQFPQVKGLASPADGPAVGMGIEDEAKNHVDEWRRKVAKFIAELRK